MGITQIWVIYIAQIKISCYPLSMNEKFAPYNTHLYFPDNYWENDHHLRLLKEQPYIYENPIIAELPRETPGIYTLGGGRQIGKTTLLKQWITTLLAGGIEADSIHFYTGELIDDHHSLVSLLQTRADTAPEQKLNYTIIDEITYIKGWDKGIKFAADAGYFRNSIVILTGSDLTLMQAARMTFPGRRGKADKVDFHVYPLTFKEYLTLKKYPIEPLLNASIDIASEEITPLYDELDLYIQHGGYLTAINDIARNGEISLATLKTYSDWIRGDVLKRNKQERYLHEILSAIIKRYNKQVSWHTLADDVSIDSHKTVSEYCELLATMDALFIQRALLEDKLVAAPKKARKLSFTDPFIYHAMKRWLNPTQNPQEQIIKDCHDPAISSELIESIVSTHYRRYYPTFYIKGEGEIDVAYVNNNKFWPIEVKWRNQVRPKDIKQISKYQRACIYSKTNSIGEINGIPILPLPLALLKIGEQELQNAN